MDKGSYARGIDVSHWQQEVDWSAVKGDGNVFAIIKASQGLSNVDKRLKINWPGIKQAGLLVSSYHFMNAHQDGARQAEHYINTMQPMIDQYGGFDLPAVLDVESRGSVTSEVLLRNIELFLQTVEQAFGHKPFVYTRYYFWKDNLRVKGQYPAWAPQYPMWVAHYTSADQPLVPTGWDRWDIWQYSESGRTSGVKSNTDMNYFNGSESDLRAWAAQRVKGAATPTAGKSTAATPTAGKSTAATVTPEPAVSTPTTASAKGPGEALPAGAIGRWPGDPNGYQEHVYEHSPQRPLQSGNDSYGKPVRYKLTSKSQDMAVSYKPIITQGGRYAIEAYIAAPFGKTQKAGYHITTYEGGIKVEKVRYINQSQNANQWVSLGEYQIDPTRPRDGYVNMTDYSNEDPPALIAFGGIRWRPV